MTRTCVLIAPVARKALTRTWAATKRLKSTRMQVKTRATTQVRSPQQTIGLTPVVLFGASVIFWWRHVLTQTCFVWHHRDIVRGSSNGRTLGFGPSYRGSNPCPRAIITEVGGRRSEVGSSGFVPSFDGTPCRMTWRIPAPSHEVKTSAESGVFTLLMFHFMVSSLCVY